MDNENLIMAISMGDPNGIGPEIILKSFCDKELFAEYTYVVYGSTKVFSYYKKILDLDINIQGINQIQQAVKGKFNVINVSSKEFRVEPGQPSKEAGALAFESLKSAAFAVKEKQAHLLVTAPIDKNTIQSEEFKFKGHTDFLEYFWEGKATMFMVSDFLKVAVLTHHIPVSQVGKYVQVNAIIEAIQALKKTLQQDYSIAQPKIAVLGLNPHAGDGGVIGHEDKDVITPALKTLFNNGTLVFGPLAADGFFGAHAYSQYDAVFAMYHDQGLAPFKALTFNQGVNFSAGLPFIRTSPDHGVAYDIAGKNMASAQSFKEAIYAAIDIYKHRTMNESLLAGRLKENAPKVLEH